MIRLFLLISFLVPSVYAREVKESVVVRQLKWVSEMKMYRLTLLGKAGVYYTPKEHLECVRHSIAKSASVSVSFDPKKLIISRCELKTQKL